MHSYLERKIENVYNSIDTMSLKEAAEFNKNTLYFTWKNQAAWKYRFYPNRGQILPPLLIVMAQVLLIN